jgi:hypothetical protein
MGPITLTEEGKLRFTDFLRIYVLAKKHQTPRVQAKKAQLLKDRRRFLRRQDLTRYRQVVLKE